MEAPSPPGPDRSSGPAGEWETLPPDTKVAGKTLETQQNSVRNHEYRWEESKSREKPGSSWAKPQQSRGAFPRAHFYSGQGRFHRHWLSRPHGRVTAAGQAQSRPASFVYDTTTTTTTDDKEAA